MRKLVPGVVVSMGRMTKSLMAEQYILPGLLIAIGSLIG
jgi:hypothetical protein